MAERSILQSGLPVDYYAPDYKIEVEGHGELDQTTKGDILEVKVTMDKENLSGFELTINNWDDKIFDFKYSDKGTFDIGNRVHIQMGYANQLRSMVQGIIISMTPRFPESGSPTIGVSGSDALVKLRDRKPGPNDRKTFEKMADWEIAQIVAKRNNLKFKATEEGEKHDIVVQKDQDELKFLMERAKRIDFDLFMRVDPNTGDDVLHFIKPTDCRDGRPVRVYVFEWGKSLINFNPTLTISDQVGTVTVRGWDPHTKQPISYTAKPEDLAHTGSGLNGPRAAQERLAEKQDIVVDRPVTSVQEARDLAVSLLQERAYKYLTGSGQVIGLPDLRPGDNVELRRLGKRFSGPPSQPFCYYVTKVVHTLGSSGYQTQFEVRTDFDGGIKK
jgi:uncharacterized protein